MILNKFIIVFIKCGVIDKTEMFGIVESEDYENWCQRVRLYNTFYTDIVRRQTLMFYKPWADQTVSFRTRYKAFLKYYAKYVAAKDMVSRELNDILYVKQLSGDALEYAVDDIRFRFFNSCKFDKEDCEKAILEENNKLYEL